jgi:hypothetical protein
VRGTAGAVLLALFAGAASAEPARGSVEWTWRIAPSEDLSRLAVTACFRGMRPEFLRLDDEGCYGCLRGPGGTPFPLPFRPQGAAAARLPADGCLRYEVDLREAARRVGTSVVGSPGAWLLRPHDRPSGTRARVAFDLPEGWSVSVPWAPRPEAAGPEFELDPTAFVLLGVAAIGRLEHDRFEASGATIETAVLDRPRKASREGIRRWLSEAARAVATIHGSFPERRLQVIVEPVPGGRDPVPFGRSYDGGGRALHLLLSVGAADADLPGEWVAVHEMVHATTPTIRPEDAWFSEGLATWYQEVARARAGLRSRERAWQNLLEGFERGRRGGTGRALREESREMHRHHAYFRVYWAGAAIALLADLELRRTTGGRTTLDAMMRLLQREPGRGAGLFAAGDLVAFFGERTGTDVVRRIAETHLARSAFPDLAAALDWLGVSWDGETLVLRNDAPGAAVREAILAAPPTAVPR